MILAIYRCAITNFIITINSSTDILCDSNYVVLLILLDGMNHSKGETVDLLCYTIVNCDHVESILKLVVTILQVKNGLHI
jgi:hypothetical protein